MMENDRYYVERCLDGHPDDFRHLVRRYQPVLLAHLAGKLGNRDRAEEAAQETLVRAYFKMDKLRKPESFFAWLLGIADLVAKEQQRKESIRRKRESVRPDAQPRRAAVRYAEGEESAEEAPEPELSQDFALEAAIAALPEAYRTVILLRYYGGLLCAGIAEQLDMPLGTVTKTLSRAYAMLRDSLQQQTASEVQQ
jgi:RNA polymerase sigma-70 factor (ECF subfamily)